MKTICCPKCNQHKVMSYTRPKLVKLKNNRTVVYDEEYWFCPTLAKKGNPEAEYIPNHVEDRNNLALHIAENMTSATHKYLLRTLITGNPYSTEVIKVDMDELKEYGLSDISVNRVIGFPITVTAAFVCEFETNSESAAFDLAREAFRAAHLEEILTNIHRTDFLILGSRQLK